MPRVLPLLLTSGTLFTCLGLLSCKTDDASETVEETTASETEAVTRPPTLPAPGGTGALSPWGGSNEALWRAEAVLANASASALNQAWAEPGVADVLVAMPLRLFPSNFFPYGDGQSNTNASFEGWKVKRPPLVATLSRFADGNVRVTFRFDREWQARERGYNRVEVRYRAPGGGDEQLSLDGTVEADGTLTASWNNPPAALGWTGTTGKGVALVRPAPQFGDFMPVTFELPVRQIEPLLASVKRQLGQNRPQAFRDFLDRTLVPDRQKLRLTDADKALLADIRTLDPNALTLPPGSPERAARAALIADINQRINELINLHRIENPGIGDARLQELRRKYVVMATDGRPSVLKKTLFLADLQPIYNSGRAQLPYMPLDIHGDFPVAGFRITTGVGMGWTWVAEQDSPFKIMYTCFERRQPGAEAQTNQNLPANERQNFGQTVASGGGWHRIGDNQETIINSLEEGPAMVAAGYGVPTERAGLALPGGGNYVYGLRDVAVFRWLHPGEAFVSLRFGDRGDSFEGRTSNHHWYYFQQDTEVCTEEWVHGFGDPNTPDFLAP